METSTNPLSQDLTTLLADAQGQPLSVGEIEDMLKGRGFALFLMLLSAPFLVPNIPGLSTPFGAAIGLMGLRMALGHKPSLPRFILERKVPFNLLERIVKVMVALISRMEKMVKPRLDFAFRGAGMTCLIGLGIASGGLFLLLPLPIPFTNSLPAISILLLTSGLMERDGLFILFGYFFGVISWVYLGIWLVAGKAGIEWVQSLF